MHSATRLDDLKILECFLQNSLHAHLGRIIPFRVHCLYKDDTLWVLAQHPTEVAIDIPDTFSVLERALQAEEPKTPLAVKLYLRAEGNKRPYTQQSFTVYPLVNKIVPGEAAPEITGTGEDRVALERDRHDLMSDPPLDSGTNDTRDSIPATIPEVVSHREQPEHAPTDDPNRLERTNDRLVNVDADAFTTNAEHSSGREESSHISIYPAASSERRQRNPLLPMLGGLGVLAIAGGAAYMGTRPCVLQVCTELSTSTQLNQSALAALRNPQVTVPAILAAQKQLHQSAENLQAIPPWSGSYDRAQKSLQTISPQVNDLDTTVAAMNQAYQAALLVKNPPLPVAKWQESKRMWTDSIASLQKIRLDSKIYPLARQKITDYQARLADINRRIEAETSAQDKLKSAVDTLDAATKSQATAKSLSEWRGVTTQWERASGQLSSIPASTSLYPQAQAKLKSAQPQLALARDKVAEIERADQNFQKAVALAEAAKLAQKNNNLALAVSQWNQSLVAIQSIPHNSPVYTQAKPLVLEYTKSFQQAQSQLKTQRQLTLANKDLQRTCTGNPQICTYTVTTKGIVVRLMAIYTQTLMQTAIAASTQGDANAKAGVLNHVNTLGNALQTIADNAKLPLEVYGADGKQIQNYRPS